MVCSVDIKGLPKGESGFKFHLDGAFFEAFENDSISDADIDVAVKVVKEAVVGLELDMKGEVTVQCDRCLADLKLPVDVNVPMVVRVDGDIMDAECDAEELVMGENDAAVDLTQAIYDYVCLSLPIKRVHPDGECDPVMMEKMKDILR